MSDIIYMTKVKEIKNTKNKQAKTTANKKVNISAEHKSLINDLKKFKPSLPINIYLSDAKTSSNNS